MKVLWGTSFPGIVTNMPPYFQQATRTPTVTYGYWFEFDQLRKKLNRAIYLKRLKLWLLSLVGR